MFRDLIIITVQKRHNIFRPFSVQFCGEKSAPFSEKYTACNKLSEDRVRAEDPPENHLSWQQ
jgi:hypothetical protein